MLLVVEVIEAFAVGGCELPDHIEFVKYDRVELRSSDRAERLFLPVLYWPILILALLMYLSMLLIITSAPSYMCEMNVQLTLCKIAKPHKYLHNLTLPQDINTSDG